MPKDGLQGYYYLPFFSNPKVNPSIFADLTYINLSFSVLNHFDYFFLVLALIIIADKLTFVVIYNAFFLVS